MKKIFVTVLILFSFISLQAQRNPMTVGVNVGTSLPMGDFNDVASMGFGLNGIFIYGLSENFEISGSLGFINWGGDKIEIANTSIEATESTTAIPMLVGARYYFPQRDVMPYATAELGMHIFTSSATETVTDLGTDDTKGDTSVDLGFAFGGGVVYEVSKGFKVDGNLKYNVISTDPSASHLSLQIGVLFGIN